MTIAVIGLGLIGTSVALAARRRWLDCRLVGVDLPEHLLHPTVTAVCDLASADLTAVAGADIIVLATPVDAIQAALPIVARLLGPGTLVTDVGSAKRTIVRAAQNAGVASFVGGHPMAGSERHGPDAARADVFDGRQWFLVEGGEPSVMRRAEAFVTGLGAVPVWTDAETHDRVVAAVSHLPQVVASALMTVAADASGDAGLRWAGSGLRDTTRLAGSSGPLWSAVLAANADEVGPLLRRMGDELHRIADDLGDTSAMARLFARANRLRARLD